MNNAYSQISEDATPIQSVSLFFGCFFHRVSDVVENKTCPVDIRLDKVLKFIEIVSTSTSSKAIPFARYAIRACSNLWNSFIHLHLGFISITLFSLGKKKSGQYVLGFPLGRIIGICHRSLFSSWSNPKNGSFLLSCLSIQNNSERDLNVVFLYFPTYPLVGLDFPNQGWNIPCLHKGHPLPRRCEFADCLKSPCSGQVISIIPWAPLYMVFSYIYLSLCFARTFLRKSSCSIFCLLDCSDLAHLSHPYFKWLNGVCSKSPCNGQVILILVLLLTYNAFRYEYLLLCFLFALITNLVNVDLFVSPFLTKKHFLQPLPVKWFLGNCVNSP